MEGPLGIDGVTYSEAASRPQKALEKQGVRLH
jgi:hypothetical protein